MSMKLHGTDGVTTATGTVTAYTFVGDGSSLAGVLTPTGDGSQLTGITGGGPSLGTDSIIRTNANTISEDITIPSGTNGSSIGPITVATGYTVTIADGARWVVL